jgi:hypothetical protein
MLATEIELKASWFAIQVSSCDSDIAPLRRSSDHSVSFLRGPLLSVFTLMSSSLVTLGYN